MIEGLIKEDGSPATAVSENSSKPILKLNVFDDENAEDDGNRSDDDNNENAGGSQHQDQEHDDDAEEIIQGLSNFSFDPQVEDEYTSKGPIFRWQRLTYFTGFVTSLCQGIVNSESVLGL